MDSNSLSHNNAPAPLDSAVQPTRRSGSAAYYNNNPHEMPRTLQDLQRSLQSTPFGSLIESGTIVNETNGRTTVDSQEAVEFLQGDVNNAPSFGFADPCPATLGPNGRISKLNASRLAAVHIDETNREPPHVPTPRSTTRSAQIAAASFIVNPQAIDLKDTQLMTYTLKMFNDPSERARLADLFRDNGRGRGLI